MSWKYNRRVKYYETDRMGVVHHSNYLRFLEDARMDWLRDNVILYSKLEKMGIIIPAVSANEKFISYLHFDDPFEVEIKLTQFTGARMKFEYIVRNSDSNMVCLTGDSTHYFAKNETGYPPFSIRKNYPDIYNSFIKQLEKSDINLAEICK